MIRQDDRTIPGFHWLATRLGRLSQHGTHFFKPHSCIYTQISGGGIGTGVPAFIVDRNHPDENPAIARTSFSWV